MSITPLPSTSYIRKAHLSFSSGVPLDVTSIASKNSCNERTKTLALEGEFAYKTENVRKVDSRRSEKFFP